MFKVVKFIVLYNFSISFKINKNKLSNVSPEIAFFVTENFVNSILKKSYNQNYLKNDENYHLSSH
jgi:hypothetical protein